MTNREFFTAIASNTSLSVDLIEFAENAIAKLDERNARRASTPTKTQRDNAIIVNIILDILSESGDYMTAADIARAVGERGFDEISTNKASALCRQCVLNGSLIETEVKNEKKNKVKAYKIAETETVSD